MNDDFGLGKRPAKSLRDVLDERSAETPTPDEPSFKTPDEVAANDLPDEKLLAKLNPSVEPVLHESAGWRTKLTTLIKRPFGKREWIASVAIVLVCGSIVGFVITHTGTKPVAVATVPKIKKVTPKSTTVPSNLTGMQVDPTVNQRPVTGVMIENSMEARPQSGLSEAGVVFEAIAEGGITRFLALFQDTAPADIGPIRSARPYYIRWALGFDAGYAHVGGSPEALNDIRALGVKDLDQFANGGAYRRISSRAAPHNVYAGIENLVQLQATKGYPTSTYTGFVRKPKAQPAKQVTARSVDISLSGPLYNVHYDYNPATNSYNRSEGGAAHMDANGNKQISPAVVIALATPFGIAADGMHSDYQTIGSGQAYIFQDGIVIPATWTKASEKSQITFADAAGQPVLLSPGQTWITAVSGLDKAASAP